MTAPPHPDNSPARDNTPGTVLVVGGTGFIGRAVLTALTRHHSPHSGTPTLLAVCRTPPRTGLPGVRYTARDLTDPATLRGICSTTVVHAASYVGPDPRQCHRINHTGTRALLDEAQRHNVKSFLYIGTTAVYGHGPHHGPREDRLTPAPASPASASRLLAEQDARAAGATILRPPLVYGTGDRWFIPTPTTSSHPSTTYHAADPQPLPWDDLLARLRTLLRLPQAPPIPLCEHRSLVRRSLPRLTDHQYALLTQEHWYTTQNIWHTTRLPPGPGFHQRLTTSTSTSTSTSTTWYTQHLAQTPH
ncbi:NAD(P)-dependent oxidoreductase [Streptomyces sp. GB4-14]|uniref:NAD-dependent epimerase/dehydratase family protein n=1 Tax=Streptomyces sp. GB4-14 TaxID=2498703 RepID=UPI001F5CDF38|nr:NAD(P)-dependent oxidoreductase [Streptomyces sp. GB4-14]